MRRYTLPLLAAALAGTACGHPAATKAPKAPTQPASFPSAAPPVGPPTAGEPSATTVARIRQTFNALPGYDVVINWYQKQGSKASSGVYDASGKPPRALRLFIKKGVGEGSKILWTGGDTAQVRPGGMLSIVAVNLPVTDDRLIGLRGYTIGEMDLSALLALMGNPANQVTVDPAGGDTLTLRARGPALLRGCQSMTAIFEAKTLYPRSVSLSDAKEEVVRMTLSGFKAKRHDALDI